MPIVHNVEARHRRVVAVASGNVSREDFFTYQRMVWSRPDVAGFDELVDLTNVAQITGATADAMRELAGLSAEMESGEHSRLAIVATGDLFSASAACTRPSVKWRPPAPAKSPSSAAATRRTAGWMNPRSEMTPVVSKPWNFPAR